jgi:phosphopentomutase
MIFEYLKEYIMAEIKRVVAIVLDGVGVGETPDSADYGDVGSNSVANTARKVGGLQLPNMEQIGLGNITSIQGVPPVSPSRGAYGKMRPISAGKDSITGHWELMGIHLPDPFPTYPDGFPPEVLAEFKLLTGLDVLGNKPASGTEIIQELGAEHMRTGKPIVYTSGDSVFQIAANEGIIPIEQQYEICLIARQMLRGEHAVGRVIARPFIGSDPSNFKRTLNRRDYPLTPPEDTMLDIMLAAGINVYGTGKIDDLFGGRGLSGSKHSEDNQSSIQGLLEYLEEDFVGFIFSNLIEFDMVFGHRNDAKGYANALETFDEALTEIHRKLLPTDVCMIVADHGVDPTTPGTDHSREYIPLLVFGPTVKSNVDLGIRSTYADVAATLAEIFHVQHPRIGTSFLKEII